ncbi:MAG TPA: amidohydrolase family protein, partial [Candidatus Krumholzibacteria bacterium]|nr:amidohydrolase family protein [Candidatus Krumholzibacteria bacterium]
MRSSRWSQSRLAGLVLLTVGCLSWTVVPLEAEPPTPPPYYAIRNVRVVTGTGASIDGATVLLANGLIEFVGKSVRVPGDARVIDGEGLTLYPGLIDAMTTLAQKTESESGVGRSGRAPVINGPEDRPGTTPWVTPVEGLCEDTRIEKWRKAGFTAAVTTPEKGIFAGQAALVSLVDRPDRQAVLSTPVAHRLNFSGSGELRSFPGSLMGVLAYLKQVFMDTDHYAKVKATYAKDPRGRVRPEYDRTLEPLATAVADKTPFLMPANLGREIDRVLVLRGELGVEAIIYGGQGAYARADALRDAGVPVLVNLNWPKLEKNRDPEAETPFRTLVHHRMAPTSPAELAASGVSFAFYSGGLASTSEIFESVRAATAHGLSNEDALAAFTSDAAAILGIADRAGTIEKGKIANVVLATDWPWADGAEVRAVFVDGRMYQERKDDEPAAAPAMDVSGTWSLTTQSSRGTRESTADITMSKDGKVKGKIVSDMGERVMDEGRMSGDVLRFKTTRESGGRSVTASWTLTVEGEKLSGTMSAGSMQMDVVGTRKAKAEAGDGAVAEKGDAADEVPLDELRAAWEVYQGAAKKMGAFAITNAQVWTVSGETIEKGTVVVSGGKIRAVGSDVKIPRDAEIIDAGGGALIPGIIDAHSHIAIEGGVNEGTLAVTSMAAIGDVVNADDIGIYRALAGGVTCANLLHGSANPIGGKNQVVKLRWGSDAEGLKFAGAPPGIKFALGENPKRSNFRAAGVPPRYPQTRMGVMDVIRDAFTAAQEYRKEWADYDAGAHNGLKPSLPRRDLALETLVEILEGRRMVHSHCYRADEILQLLRTAEEFGFRVATLQHVLEGYKIADEIAAHGAGASTFSDWWGYKVEAYEAIPHNAALMTERGVVVSINSDSGEEMRHLNQEAAKAVRWGGMGEVDALKLVTLNPARQLGIDHRVGSIEVGKDADLVLYDGHPLSTRSVVQKTFIDGDLYFDL